MTQSSVNLPLTGSGDTSAKAAVKKLSTNEVVQQIELVTAVDGGGLTPIASGNPLEVAIVGTVPISGAPTTVTANLGTLNGAGLDTSLQSILTQLNTNTTNVNVFRINGQAMNLGAGTIGTGTQRVVLATDQAQLTNALKVDASATIQPVSSTTLATAAKQPALGTAGSASADVLSIQGISGGVAIPVTGGGTPTDQQQTTTFSTPTTSTPITGLNGISTVVVEVISGASNTATGVTWGVQGSQDGTNWETLSWMTTTALVYNAAGTGISNITGLYYFLAAGMAQVRINVAAIASGNFPTNLRTTSGFIMPRQTTVGIVGAIPAGTNAIGSLTAGSALIGKVGIDQTTPGTTDAVTSKPLSATPTLTQVAGSASSVTILASNASRKAAVIVNDSTAILYLAFAATATTAAYTYKLASQATLELPVAGRVNYTGLLSGIWTAAAGNAVVTELA